MNAPADFRFDPVAHRYTLRDAEVPSVTKILRLASDLSGVKPEILEAARARGVWVHAATEIIDRHRAGEGEPLDWSTVSAEISPFVRAYEAFVEAMRPSWSFMEQPLLSILFGFAGTPDRGGQFPTDPAEWVVDIKTGQHYDWHPLQTAGYRLLMYGPGRLDVKRASIYLRDDGSFRFREHTNPRDEAHFLSFLNVHKWRVENGISN